MRLLFLLAVVSAGPLVAQPIVVDHESIPLFERIPRRWIDSAARLRMVYMDRSVGANINDALGCLAQPWESAPSFCKRYQHRDSAYAVDPSEVRWAGVWDRSRWRFEPWPEGCSEDALCFINWVEPRIDSFDVVGFQNSYLGVAPGTRLHDPVEGFFGSKTDRGTAAAYAAFAERHPEATVIWWTSSLARSIGSPESQAFNDAMRSYARSYEVVLFDVADILSHTPAGAPCFDNRDGIAYLTENHPDDGLSIPAICPQYTTETEGGHLGSISAGGIRVAKAFWVLMARIAGWDGLDTVSRVPVHPTSDNGLRLTVRTLPAADGIVVSYTGLGNQEASLELYDIRGDRVATYTLPGSMRDGELSIPTSAAGLESGWYLVRLRSAGHAATAEVVVRR